MTLQLLNVATIFNAASAGLGNFVVASALAGGSLTPEQAAVTDGKVYEYYAQTADGLTWEAGAGAYTVSSHTLARTTIKGTSNGDTVKVNFPTVPIVCVIPSPSSTLEQGQVVAGSKTLWQQSTAPTGWTKDTTHNDKTLRVVSGAASSGGSNTFSSVMAQTTVANHTDSTTEMPNHAHSEQGVTVLLTLAAGCGAPNGYFPQAQSTGGAGGGAAHNHAITMNMLYVDVIIATKN